MTICPPLEKPTATTESVSIPWLSATDATTSRAKAMSSTFSLRAGKELWTRASFQLLRYPSR